MTVAARTSSFRDDPHPEFRCRCVHRTVYFPDLARWVSTADPYIDRCPDRATQEDGLCDHCRGGIPPTSDEGWRDIGQCFICGPDFKCCLHPSQIRQLVDLTTPCRAVDR